MNFDYSYKIPSFQDFTGQSLPDLLSMLSGMKTNFNSQRYGHESDLQAKQIGEQGREFDASTNFGREQEGNKYRYLDELLRFDRDKQAADNSFRERARNAASGDLLREQIMTHAGPGSPIREAPSWTKSPFWSQISGYSQR